MFAHARRDIFQQYTAHDDLCTPRVLVLAGMPPRRCGLAGAGNLRCVDLVYFGKLKSSDGSIVHCGDEREGDEDLGEGFLLCSCCAEPARLRPDIVWFGEMPLHMEAIYTAVDACEVFVVVGSSGHVYPAADLVHIAKANGARTVLVNAEAPLNVDAFDEVHLGKAGELLPELVNTWLQTTV